MHICLIRRQFMHICLLRSNLHQMPLSHFFFFFFFFEKNKKKSCLLILRHGMLTVQLTKYWQYFSYFSKKIGSDISWKLSPICMKYQSLFSGKIRQNISKYCLPTYLLTLKTPRKTASENVVCLCRLLNILANFSNLFLHTGKQCEPRSDCS